jgi:hypothetical protein
MKTMVLYCFIALFFTACQSLQRSRDSGYGAGPSKTATKVVYSSDHQYKPQDKASLSLRQKINQMEKKLKSNSEKEHYSRILPWFESDDERLEYLLLPELEAKEEWAKNNSVWQRSASPSDQTLNLVQSQDIAVGMPRDFVRKSWGEPQSVDVSGDPSFLNERWKYLKYISSSQGYKQEKKIVYFEGGKVVGWSTD